MKYNFKYACSIKKKQAEKRLKEFLKRYPAVAILGARQVGKSTLSKEVLAQFKGAIYLDLQLPRELNKLSDPEAFFELNHQSLILS